MQEYSPQITALQISTTAKSKSLVQCREGDSFTLATAKKQNGLDSVETLLKQFIILLAGQLNLTKLSEQSVDAMAEDLYEVAYYLKVEELYYFFKQLRRGTYGQMYENLNSEKLCRAMNKYLLDRANYFERKSMGIHSTEKDTPDTRINETTQFRQMHKAAILKHAAEKKWASTSQTKYSSIALWSTAYIYVTS